jgi:FO synthase
MTNTADIAAALAAASSGRVLSHEQALALAECNDLPRLTALAEEICLAGHGTTVTFSKKVFIPLTRLCRDVCHYCTFARAPNDREPHYLLPDAVLAIARAGQAAGCKEALFTLGDQPEHRYATAREALTALGFDSTLAYMESSAALVLRETGLLPHLNPGVMDEAWLARLRKVSVSQGIMLETASERLSQRGGPHFGSPDKAPAVRLATLEAAGRARVPFTTGILIGIGETRAERIEALLAIRDVHKRHGHIQEVIVQNFRAKPGTRMAAATEPSLEDHAWTIAVARLILGPAMNIQAPPNLQPAGLAQLIGAGINDWGGASCPARPRQPRAPAAPRRSRARHRGRPHTGGAAGCLSRVLAPTSLRRERSRANRARMVAWMPACAAFRQARPGPRTPVLHQNRCDGARPRRLLGAGNS